MTAISIDSVAEFVAQTSLPLATRLATDDGIIGFVEELGWTLPSVPAALVQIHGSAIAISTANGALLVARQDGTAAEEAAATLAMTGAMLTLVRQINDLPQSLASQLTEPYLTESGIASTSSGLRKRLLDHLLLGAIAETSMIARGVLVALGIIEETPLDADDNRHQPEFVLREFLTDRVTSFVGNPTSAMHDVYGWGTPVIKIDRLFRTMNVLSFGIMSPAELLFPSDEFVNSVFGTLPPGTPVSAMINIPLGSNGIVGLEVAISPAPKLSPTENQGLALRLIGLGQDTLTFGVGAGLELVLNIQAALDTGIGVLLRPGAAPQLLVGVEGAGNPLLAGGLDLQLRAGGTDPPLRVASFGSSGGLDVQAYHVGLELGAAPPDVTVSAAIDQGRLSFSLATADGFIQGVAPKTDVSLPFNVGIAWSKSRGFYVTGSAGLEVAIPINASFGPLKLRTAHVAIDASTDALSLGLGVDFDAKLGPVTASIQDIGVAPRVRFVAGNLGPADLSFGFKAPTGVGIAIEAGPVSGGGFLSVKDGTYFGALELSIYSVAVKAFGLVETKLPAGGPKFSFVILISAEFTPIQLGLGFTLNGVGGLIGINRTVDATALSKAVVDGKIDQILFPTDVVEHAPALVHDLGAYFPSAKDRTIFGPLAKIGWGTPTLVEAKLGFVLELPGPILTILGNIQAHLPKAVAGGRALVILNLDIAGRLDFPKKHFELEGRLHDSWVGNYPVSGGMATRLDWGDRPNFAISLGGFNPNFNPPSGFPHLERLSVNLGLNGNPTVTLSGYLALTSNTAQIGAALDARVSKYGASLRGNLAFDAIFVFSPFSFDAEMSGGVHVDFHGVGFNLTFHGRVSGPSPWRITGEVCVGVWFASACVGFNETLGDESKPVLPRLDPWIGSDKDQPLAEQEVPGLRPALKDVRNWSGVLPPGAVSGVSYRKAANGAVPVDPVGIATFRQKAIPLDYAISRYGGTAPLNPGASFRVSSVAVTGSAEPPLSTNPISDYFAPGQYREMKNAEKLSSPAFDLLHAGFELKSKAVRAGAVVSKTPEFDTSVIDENGVMTSAPVYTPTLKHLSGMLSGVAAARLGLRLTGAGRFTDVTLLRKVTDKLETFVLTNKQALIPISGSEGGLSRSEASELANSISGSSRFSRRDYQVLPSYLAQVA